MSITVSGRSIRNAAFAAALAVCLALGLAIAAMPQKAQADPATGLSFTVNSSGPGSYSVTAYQLFAAEIDGSDKATNVTWNANYKAQVLSFLEDTAKTGLSQTFSAWCTANGKDSTSDDAALEFIAENITNSPGLSSPGGKAPADNSFAAKLAQYMATTFPSTNEGMGSITGPTGPATFSNLTEGYYLFYIPNEPAMWTTVGGSTASGTVKNPTYFGAKKKVKEGNSWENVTDASCGDTVTFRVYGDLPTGLTAGNEPQNYKYTLHDTAQAGLQLETNNVAVYASDGTNETALSSGTYAATYNSGSNTLDIAISDLYSDASVNYATTQIIFEYTAKVTAGATLGTTYNENGAFIEYGTDTSAYQTDEVFARVVTYELDIVKKGSDTGNALQGARFTLSYVDGGTTYYAQADGSFATTQYEFSSNSTGAISIQRIDEGTYTLTETVAPSGYKLPSNPSRTVVITGTLNQADPGTLTALSATVDGGAAITGDVATGKIEIEIENDPTTVLPITGMTPNQLGTVIGLLLVAAGVAAIVVRARRKTRA